MPLGDADTLREQGWEEPLDDSPIDLPDGWHYGGVRHTGGGIYCRSWFSVPDPSDIHSGEYYYEVTYGSEFRGVSLEKYAHNGDRTQFEGVVADHQADDHTDIACAEIAREMMLEAEKLDSE